MEGTVAQPRVVVACVFGVALAAFVAAAPAAQTPPVLTTDALFQQDKVWTVQLTMTSEAFTKMTPWLPVPGQPTRPVPASAGAGAPAAPAAAPRPAAAPPPPPPPSAPSPAAAPPRPPQVPTELTTDLLKSLLGVHLGPEGGRNGLAAERGVEFEYVHAAFEIGAERFADVAVRAKGNGSFQPVNRFLKPSFKIDLNKYVKGQNLAGLSSINLHNNITEPSWMNEVLAFRLYRDAGVPAPRTAYAQVFLSIPGGEQKKYLGLYSVVENIDEDFMQSRFKVEGGTILKPATRIPFRFITRNWADYNQMYDPKTTLTDADKKRVMDFCELVTSGTDQQFTSQIGDYVDLDAFAKYMAVVSWLANPDSVLQAGQNYYVFMHPTTKRMAFLPWDQDHSWGQFVPFVPAERQQQLDIMHPWTDRVTGLPFDDQLQNNLLVRTFGLEAFKKKYLQEMATLTRTLTQPDRIAAQVDALGAVLAPFVAQEPKDGRVISFQESLGEADFKRPVNQNVTVTPIKTFLKVRQAVVLSQLKALGVQ